MFVVLAVVVLLWIMSLRVVVPTNMVHIVQQGKNTIEYGKGRVAVTFTTGGLNPFQRLVCRCV